MDECELSVGGLAAAVDCEFNCVNTPGSYKCVTNDYFGAAADQPVIEEVLTCPPGFQLNDTTGICDGTWLIRRRRRLGVTEPQEASMDVIDEARVLVVTSVLSCPSAFVSSPGQTSTSANWTTGAALMCAETALAASIVRAEMVLFSPTINSPVSVS